MIKSRKILITGGSGFIGSHLALRLSKNNEVKVLDLRPSKLREVEFVQGDIRNQKIVSKVVKGIDIIYHLAAQTNGVNSIKNKIYDLSVNVLGTLNLLKAASLNNISNFVYFSSAAVYGNSNFLPLKEDSVTVPLTPYGLSKLTAEKYCDFFDLNICIIRLFNGYGPGQSLSNQYSGVISRFISNVSQGKSPVIYGDGLQTRDFIYIHDIVDVAILLSSKKGVYNVGSGKATTIKELASMVVNLFSSNVPIKYTSPRKGDIFHSVADISKIKKLGFEPKYSLKEGLKEMTHKRGRKV